ncbi:lipopolysaccharide assembly LapA domain-containing protein [Listeria sp. PSOL-1]|uniref:LapA family protein n=1 Tax=Listeria sp. PSOL-1 TaxID=1844999 RepID=UPI0013D3C886|nr:lipopolysaccharide assembly protein LapA domain-containing protein [Listeria sp. PSOL-1]
MKIQWQVVTGIVLALMIAVFAVINTDPVEVNFLFTKADWPLILLILGSVLIGCLIMFFLNIAKARQARKEVRQLNEEINDLKRQLAAEEALGMKKIELEKNESKQEF